MIVALCVQVDETSDVSTEEQVSTIARLDKGSEIVERQLGFVDVSTNKNAAAISQVVKDKLASILTSRTNLLCKHMVVLLSCLGILMVFRLLFVKSILLLILSVVQPID